MGGAPPLPHDFAPQGVKNWRFFANSALDPRGSGAHTPADPAQGPQAQGRVLGRGVPRGSRQWEPGPRQRGSGGGGAPTAVSCVIIGRCVRRRGSLVDGRPCRRQAAARWVSNRCGVGAPHILRSSELATLTNSLAERLVTASVLEGTWAEPRNRTRGCTNRPRIRPTSRGATRYQWSGRCPEGPLGIPGVPPGIPLRPPWGYPR